MDDLGSSVSRSSFAIMILTPYSLGNGTDERKGKEKGDEEKYEKIFLTEKQSCEL